jgi:hypothetical protein
MTRPLGERARLATVFVFAMAMAWVEAACVYYLRVLVDRIEPHRANPLPLVGAIGEVELAREAATLVMLVTLGMLAGRTWQVRCGYTAIAFGVWDIFYYVFLRLMTGWPRSLFDWDILFLLPLPWWGPVIAPMLIALLMIVGGTLATRSAFTDPASAFTRTLWGCQVAGIALALYVFMADALGALSHGLDVRTVLPATFNWPLYGVAFALMAAPIVEAGWTMRPRRHGSTRRRDAGSHAAQDLHVETVIAKLRR